MDLRVSLEPEERPYLKQAKDQRQRIFFRRIGTVGPVQDWISIEAGLLPLEKTRHESVEFVRTITDRKQQAVAPDVTGDGRSESLAICQATDLSQNAFHLREERRYRERVFSIEVRINYVEQDSIPPTIRRIVFASVPDQSFDHLGTCVRPVGVEEIGMVKLPGFKALQSLFHFPDGKYRIEKICPLVFAKQSERSLKQGQDVGKVITIVDGRRRSDGMEVGIDDHWPLSICSENGSIYI